MSPEDRPRCRPRTGDAPLGSAPRRTEKTTPRLFASVEVGGDCASPSVRLIHACFTRADFLDRTTVAVSKGHAKERPAQGLFAHSLPNVEFVPNVADKETPARRIFTRHTLHSRPRAGQIGVIVRQNDRNASLAAENPQIFAATDGSTNEDSSVKKWPVIVSRPQIS
jgi:hypothetical protein